MKYLFWDKFKKDIEAFTTTTEIGNMAYQIDEGKDVLKHREIVAKDFNIPLNKFTFVHQHHSDIILKVTEKDIGKGMNSFDDGLNCDALYTSLKNVPLGIFHADCVPIFFYVPKAHIVGIVHSGFQGTLKEILKKSILKVMKDENLKPDDFYFYIGPSRKFFHFEINNDDINTISKLGYTHAIKGKGDVNLLDLPFMNYMMLIDINIDPSHIEMSPIDTYDNPLLYSAYQKANGRNSSIIFLK